MLEFNSNSKIYSNQQLLLTDITRGSQALAIGLDGIIWERCKADGGCANAMPIPKFGIALSWGLSVPKNPPHPDAAKVFINWFLSKDGQAEFVRDWPKYNDAGAVSMRKDVAPSPGAADRLPDFANPDQYAFIASEKGAKEVANGAPGSSKRSDRAPDRRSLLRLPLRLEFVAEGLTPTWRCRRDFSVSRGRTPRCVAGSAPRARPRRSRSHTSLRATGGAS